MSVMSVLLPYMIICVSTDLFTSMVIFQARLYVLVVFSSLQGWREVPSSEHLAGELCRSLNDCAPSAWNSWNDILRWTKETQAWYLFKARHTSSVWPYSLQVPVPGTRSVRQTRIWTCSPVSKLGQMTEFLCAWVCLSTKQGEYKLTPRDSLEDKSATMYMKCLSAMPGIQQAPIS